MVFQSRCVLTVGAHPDDIELGVGGVIRVASVAGARVIAVYLTKGEVSGDPEVRSSESRQALELLGTKDVFFGDFKDAEIPSSHSAVKYLESFVETFSPDVVFTHTVHDTHQDHRQVSSLSLSAFRNVDKLLAYETPRSTGEFRPSYFVDISKFAEDKWKALKCHASQKRKRYLGYEAMVNLSSYRGSQVNVAAAEAFEVIKYVERSI